MAKHSFSKILFLACSFAATTFMSCSKDDNPSENLNPYKICWKTDLKAEKDNMFLVQANGGTFTFDFYRGEPWLESVKETVKEKSVVTNAEYGCEKIETSWTNANIVKDEGINRKLTVTISPSNTAEMRYIYVVVTNSVKSKVIAFKQLGVATQK